MKIELDTDKLFSDDLKTTIDYLQEILEEAKKQNVCVRLSADLNGIDLEIYPKRIINEQASKE